MRSEQSGRESPQTPPPTPPYAPPYTYRREFRHEFRPGKLVAGLALLGIATVYLGDAGGLWETPSGAALPMLGIGLALAGIVNWLAYGVRRRSARKASAESSGDPASRSGSQAMR
ncbi:hypothetical protein OG709_22120 [Streptomyces sp. NBC_01267]|uniref:hypothetical protein n=1 Tax=unclassified Streptomyces TaxID=2593676 RepID=UPI00202576BF|nr:MULTISPECIES: hypothetical protein [unclassified Streptomyces]